MIEDLCHSFKRHDKASTLEFIKDLVEGIGMVLPSERGLRLTTMLCCVVERGRRQRGVRS